MGFGLCSAAIHYVSYDFIFTALELSALKPWWVRLASESDCTVTDCGSHVKRVLTLSDVLTLRLAFSFFFGHGGMLDLPSASRTCPADVADLTFFHSCDSLTTVQKKRGLTTAITANGEVQTNEDATV